MTLSSINFLIEKILISLLALSFLVVTQTGNCQENIMPGFYRDNNISAIYNYEKTIVNGIEIADSTLVSLEEFNSSGIRTRRTDNYKSGKYLSEYEYISDTLCIRERRYFIATNHLLYTMEYRYDKKGNRTKTYKKTGKSSKVTQENKYDDWGRLTEVKYFNKKNISITKYQYNSQSLESKQTQFNGKVFHQEKTSLYNPSGVLIEEQYTYGAPDTVHYPKGRIGKRMLTYKNDQLDTEISFLENGKINSSATFIYTSSPKTITQITNLDSNYVVYTSKKRPVIKEKIKTTKQITIQNDQGLWYKNYLYNNDLLRSVRVSYFIYFEK